MVGYLTTAIDVVPEQDSWMASVIAALFKVDDTYAYTGSYGYIEEQELVGPN